MTRPNEVFTGCKPPTPRFAGRLWPRQGSRPHRGRTGTAQASVKTCEYVPSVRLLRACPSCAANLGDGVALGDLHGRVAVPQIVRVEVGDACAVARFPHHVAGRVTREAA